MVTQDMVVFHTDQGPVDFCSLGVGGNPKLVLKFAICN